MISFRKSERTSLKSEKVHVETPRGTTTRRLATPTRVVCASVVRVSTCTNDLLGRAEQPAENRRTRRAQRVLSEEDRGTVDHPPGRLLNNSILAAVWIREACPRAAPFYSASAASLKGRWTREAPEEPPLKFVVCKSLKAAGGLVPHPRRCVTPERKCFLTSAPSSPSLQNTAELRPAPPSTSLPVLPPHPNTLS